MTNQTTPNSSRIVPGALLLTLLTLLPSTGINAQKTESAGGVKIVHNLKKAGQWGKTPRIALVLVRKIGDVDAPDEAVAFNQPSDVALDADGNLYILDSANARIQKFGPQGEFLSTFGRKGQGPGEFTLPDSLSFDASGRLNVFDPYQRRIQVISGDGQDLKIITLTEQQLSLMRAFRGGGYAAKGRTVLPAKSMPGVTAPAAPAKLIKIIDAKGRLVREFGDLIDLGDALTSGFGSSISFDVSARDEIVTAYRYRNRVEKYSKDGTLIWRADRPLNYSDKVIQKGRITTTGSGGVNTTAPEMNSVSVGVTVDGKGRALVVTYDRQLKEEEQVSTSISKTEGKAGGLTVSSRVRGDTDIRTTDAFKLEVFDPDGVLLGEIPLTHFVDFIRFQGNSLYMIDSLRGASVYQYRIVEQ